MGFNQKMHLVADIFGKAIKSLAAGLSEAEFEVIVQKLLGRYERDILDPELMAEELRLILMQPQLLPLLERYKRLLELSYSDFQQFCRSFCEDVKIEASAYGNMHKHHAVDIVKSFLNNLSSNRVENVSLFNTFILKPDVN